LDASAASLAANARRWNWKKPGANVAARKILDTNDSGRDTFFSKADFIRSISLGAGIA
jgi:hypothetical protein